MKRLILLLTLTLTLILSACANEPPITIEDACGTPLETFKDTPAIESFDTAGLNRTSLTLTGYFATVLSLTMYTEPGVDTGAIFECVEMIYQTVHQQATSYEFYEGIHNIYAINQNPERLYDIDPILHDILELGIAYSNQMDGLFDITLGPVLSLWDDAMIACNEEGDCALPGQNALDEANQYTGLDRIDLTDTIVQLEAMMNLELGGIAKGYAAGLVGDFLRYHAGVKGFLINAGTSNIEVYGVHPERDNGQWLIALRHPDGETLEPYAKIYLNSGEHIVTSGDYQRYFEVENTVYHHIIDPRTLHPGNEMRSITIIGVNGVFGDVLSTTAFLYPPFEAIALVESFGYYAIIYDLNGQILYSEGLESQIESLTTDK